MPFGKFKGKPMQDVPVSYLHYLWHKGLKHDRDNLVHQYIKENMSILESEDKDLIWD